VTLDFRFHSQQPRKRSHSRFFQRDIFADYDKMKNNENGGTNLVINFSVFLSRQQKILVSSQSQNDFIVTFEGYRVHYDLLLVADSNYSIQITSLIFTEAWIVIISLTVDY